MDIDKQLEQLMQSAAGPASFTSDGNSIRNYSLNEKIQMIEFLQKQKEIADRKGRSGIVFKRIISRGH